MPRNSGAAQAARYGLVSVPTSDKARSAIPFRVKADAAAVARAVGSFTLDTEATRLSRLRRSVGFSARGHGVSKKARSSDQALMVTLTYAGTNADWQPRHISGFVKNVREWFRARALPFRYVWVAELQKRGVIHYHACIWVPAGLRLPKPDECGWWPHGMTRIEVARAAIPYLLKYLSKDTSKTFGRFPRGARIYGVGGLDHATRRARRWLGLPSFVQANSSIFDGWHRAEGGGWIAPTGEVFESEFRRVHVGGQPSMLRICEHPRALDASGPFCWLEDRARAYQSAHFGRCDPALPEVKGT